MSWLLFAVLAMTAGVVRLGLVGRLNSADFPWGTLLVNLSGAFMAGLAQARLSGAWAVVVVAGLLGSFTTFSGFAVEAHLLHRDGYPVRAAAYVASTLLGAVALAWAGLVV